jgi:hypothetical protein
LEQQPLLLVQSSPRVEQFPPALAQTPFVHWLLQHAVLDVQDWPATVQVVAVEHLSVAGSQ